MAASDVGMAVRADAKPSASRGGELTIALALVLAGLFVFFWRQPTGIMEAMRLALPDSDDAMRLLGVRDFLAGQSWFDTTQYRYLPPDGVAMHWSRLVDLPLAGGILTLTPFLGPNLAEKVFVTAWPLFLFVVYAGVIFGGARKLFGMRAGGLAVFIAAQVIVFGDIFAPGRIDHHNIQVILVSAAAIAFGLSQRNAPAAIASGGLSALSLAVGLETLPFIACIGAAFALAWIAKADRTGRAFLYFGASLAVCTVVAFAVQTAPPLWLTPACDALSTPWLLLTTGGGLVACGLVASTPRLRSWQSRLATATLAGAALIIAFALGFPRCLDGPYQILPEPFRGLWLHDILEAFSFRRFWEVNPNAALQSVPPMLVAALALSIAAWRDRTYEQRAMLGLLAGLLWIGVLLAQVQIRTVYISSAVFPLAAGWFLDRLLKAQQARLSIAPRLGSLVCGMLMFGLVWVAGQALFDEVVSGAARKPATRIACNDPRYIAPLSSLPQGVVLGQVDLGPNILLHTGHSIVVGGYHRAAAGIIAGIEAFTGDEAEMRRQVDRFRVDYVVVCPSWVTPREGDPEPFAKTLAEGRPVDWLQPLALSGGPLKVWRVGGER